MKNLYLFQRLFTSLIFLSFTILLHAAPLSPQRVASLYDHLLEVNQEWSAISPEKYDLCIPTFFANDEARIQKHLQLVEAILRSRQYPALSPLQQQKRLAQLDVLRHYWQSARFPVNTQHAQRQPYFIDDFGTACAVGYLVQQDGATDLVAQIAQENNYAYLRQMEYPALDSWAQINGFTLDELAWIQPGYGPWQVPIWHGPGSGLGTEGIVESMLYDEGTGLLYMGGLFGEMDGELARNIVAWDGDNWHTFGSGPTGYIKDMAIGPDNNLYVAGFFSLHGAPTNIAYWDGDSWHGLQVGGMNGTIEALIFYQENLYIGGDFQSINGQEMKYLAYLENGVWSNAGKEAGWAIPGAFSVDQPVRSFAIVEEELLVGGYFTQTATANAQANQLETDYLAFWDGNDWTRAMEGEYFPVNVVRYIDGSIYVGSEVHQEILYAVYTDGTWHYLKPFAAYEQEIFPTGDSLIHEFLVYEDRVYMLGGYQYFPTNGISGQGITRVSPSGSASGVDYLKDGVRAAEVFGDKLFVAGDIEKHNGVAYFVEGGGVAVEEVGESLDLKVWASADELLVNYEALSEQAQFEVYNLNGQLLRQEVMPLGQGEVRITTTNLASGTYVYRVVSGRYQESGKVVVVKG